MRWPDSRVRWGMCLLIRMTVPVFLSFVVGVKLNPSIIDPITDIPIYYTCGLASPPFFTSSVINFNICKIKKNIINEKLLTFTNVIDILMEAGFELDQ